MSAVPLLPKGESPLAAARWSEYRPGAGPQFNWALEIYDTSGNGMPFGRFDDLGKLNEALDRMEARQQAPIHRVEIAGHFSLALGPECTDEDAKASLQEMNWRVRAYFRR